MVNRDSKVELRGQDWGFLIVSVLVSAALLSGCNVQVSMNSAQAAPVEAASATSVQTTVGGFEDPSSQIQGQLMHSYTHDAMADFIISNSGAQGRGF